MIHGKVGDALKAVPSCRQTSFTFQEKVDRIFAAGVFDFLNTLFNHHDVRACMSLYFLLFFFLLVSSLVSVLASRRFECCERISSNLDFASLKSASDLDAISC